MNKCLILVEGPFDKLRLDCLLDLFKEDKIEEEDKEALYLTGKNKNNIVAVKVLEVIPEIKEEKKITTKGKNKINKKKEEK